MPILHREPASNERSHAIPHPPLQPVQLSVPRLIMQLRDVEVRDRGQGARDEETRDGVVGPGKGEGDRCPTPSASELACESRVELEGERVHAGREGGEDGQKPGRDGGSADVRLGIEKKMANEGQVIGIEIEGRGDQWNGSIVKEETLVQEWRGNGVEGATDEGKCVTRWQRLR
ncbi:hypothetical protein OF83DRAFT_660579 [Amylostereum chailletii]|nr:hypothetical protein OF83DRAFT_660579 [Amylostereum chailletii]